MERPRMSVDTPPGAGAPLARAERAAAFLLALDETASGALAAGLGGDELAEIARAMDGLEPLDAPELEALMERFAVELSAARRAA